MSEEYTQSTLIESARRLVKLHEKPEPGFAGWHAMAQQRYEDLRDNVLAEEERRAEQASKWENVYYNESGYELRLLRATVQRRKLADATSPEVSNDGNCKWCGFPKNTQHRDHEYESSDCMDHWHVQVHGQGRHCRSCGMTSVFTPNGMRRVIPCARGPEYTTESNS